MALHDVTACERCNAPVTVVRGVRLNPAALVPHQCAVDDYLKCFTPSDPSDVRWLLWRKERLERR